MFALFSTLCSTLKKEELFLEIDFFHNKWLNKILSLVFYKKCYQKITKNCFSLSKISWKTFDKREQRWSVWRMKICFCNIWLFSKTFPLRFPCIVLIRRHFLMIFSKIIKQFFKIRFLGRTLNKTIFES